MICPYNNFDCSEVDTSGMSLLTPCEECSYYRPGYNEVKEKAKRRASEDDFIYVFTESDMARFEIDIIEKSNLLLIERLRNFLNKYDKDKYSNIMP